MIDEAIRYVLDNAVEPALNHSALKKHKGKVQHSKNLVSKFRKIGDLNQYLDRFTYGHGTGNDKLYEDTKRVGLQTFEDLAPKFKIRYKAHLLRLAMYLKFLQSPWKSAI